MSSIERRKVFITGASSGIGAETAQTLALMGYDVGLGAREKAKRAGKVVEAINSDERSGHAELFMGDLTKPDELEAVVKEVKDWSGATGLDLVLNAAGGLEPWVDEDPVWAGRRREYALAINRDAQVGLVEGLLDDVGDDYEPVLEDGTVVAVASHWSHFADQGIVMPPIGDVDYDIVASTKLEGKRAVARSIEAAQRNVRLIEVCGGIVLGTTVGDFGMRDNAEFAAEQKRLKNIVHKEEMAIKVAAAITNPAYQNGDVLVAGADLDKFLEHSKEEQ